MTLQTDQVEQRLIQYPLDCPVFVEIDVRRNANLYSLRLTQIGGQKGDLCRAVHDYSSDPGVGRVAQLARSSGHAVHDDLVWVHARDERGRELAA
jgi:hypothetical protein